MAGQANLSRGKPGRDATRNSPSVTPTVSQAGITVMTPGKRRTRVRWLALILVLASLSLAGWMWLRWRSEAGLVPAQTFSLQTANSGEWTKYGGSWDIANGAVESDSYERGPN